MPINSKRHDHHRLPYKNLFEGTYTQLHLRIILTGGIDTLVSQAGAQYSRHFKQCIDFGTVIPSDQELIAKIMDPLESEYVLYQSTEEYKDILYINSNTYGNLQKFHKECWTNALMTALSITRFQMLNETILHFTDTPDKKPNLVGELASLANALEREVSITSCSKLAKCAITLYESYKTLKHNERLIHSELDKAFLSCIITTLAIPRVDGRSKESLYEGKRIVAKLKEHDGNPVLQHAGISVIYHNALIEKVNNDVKSR